MNKSIKFVLGEENSHVINSIKSKDDYNKTIFKSQFLAAFQCIDRYLANQDPRNPQNNIFSFLGERGSGKTSCMLSVSKMLSSEDKKEAVNTIKEVEGLNSESLKSIENYQFYELGMIDPSYFDERHNILEFFIAKLYKSFREYSEHHNIDKYNQQKMVKAFAKTQKDLKYMFSEDEKYYSSVEQLQHLATADDLKKDFEELVDTYNTTIKGSDSIMVVCIDDIDLNTRQAAVMTEQIRKYLFIPNVIVLMALKYNQLDRVKQLDYIKEYEPLLGKKRRYSLDYEYEEKVAHDAIKDMSIRYLIKLLPEEQKIHMPEMKSMIDTPVELYQGIKLISRDKSFAQYIIEEIVKKTTYKIDNSKYNAKSHSLIDEHIINYNAIIPNNLRDIRQLIKLLHDMDELPKENNSRIVKDNQLKFQQYLFETWSLLNIDASSRESIEELRNISTGSELNASVIRLFYEHFKSIFSNPSEEEINYIMNPQNFIYNYSLGDIIAVIEFAEKKTTVRKDLNFIYLIKFIYTIKMHEFQDTDEYYDLVGGCYFNSRIYGFIPTPRGEVDYNIRRINIESMKELFPSNTSGDGSDCLTPIKEFFMMCILRGIHRKFNPSDKDTIDNNYRTRPTNWIFEDFHNNQKNVVFDINAFLFNWFNLSRCEERIRYLILENSTGKEKYELGNFECIQSPNQKLTDYDNIINLKNKLENARFDGKNATGFLRFSYFIKLLGESLMDVDHNLNDFAKKLEKCIENEKDVFSKVFDSGKIIILKNIKLSDLIKRSEVAVSPLNLAYRINQKCPFVYEMDAYAFWLVEHKEDKEFSKEAITKLVKLINDGMKEIS